MQKNWKLKNQLIQWFKLEKRVKSKKQQESTKQNWTDDR